jgi:dTDP-4-amino-4,6-dideoxygalactose transaminase
MGLMPGAEIVQPAINFVASANMTVAVGAVPVFAEIVDFSEPTLDPADLLRRITPKTKAVVVMHYGGYVARMSEIVEICRQKQIPIVEDACHAVGARFLDPARKEPHGKMAGGLGDVGCFSFFSNKNMAVGEGGMITTDRDDLAQRIRFLRSHGMTTLTWDRHRGHADSYDVSAHGYNYRLDEIHAALGRVQLRKLPLNNERRGRIVAEYKRRLSGLPGWQYAFADYGGNSAYHLAVLVAPDEDCRSRLAQALKFARIQTSLHYPFIPRFQAFQNHQADALERSRSYARRAITLPLFPGMTEAQVEEICSIICSNI